jgi:hypothetical protein
MAVWHNLSRRSMPDAPFLAPFCGEKWEFSTDQTGRQRWPLPALPLEVTHPFALFAKRWLESARSAAAPAETMHTGNQLRVKGRHAGIHKGSEYQP